MTPDGTDALLDMPTATKFHGHRDLVVELEEVNGLRCINLAGSAAGSCSSGCRYGDQDGQHYRQHDAAARSALGDSGGGHSQALPWRWDGSPVTTPSSVRDYRSILDFSEV